MTPPVRQILGIRDLIDFGFSKQCYDFLPATEHSAGCAAPPVLTNPDPMAAYWRDTSSTDTHAA